MKNRDAPEVEEAVVEMALESPAYGQVRVSNELRKKGILVSTGGARSIWRRHALVIVKKRLKALEIKVAKERIVYIEEQIQALQTLRREREESLEEIGTYHPGYLIAQDTCKIAFCKEDLY